MIHPAGIAIDSVEISDDNREPISWDYELIENSQRMIDGTMRKYIVGRKRRISTSWKMLPSFSTNTSDGHEAVSYLDQVWATRTDPVTLTVHKIDDEYTQGDQYEDIEVYFEKYTKTLVKRGVNVRMWDISVEFVEV